MIKKKFVWRVWTKSDKGGRVSFHLVGEYGTKREAVAQIPAKTRDITRMGRDYSYTGKSGY